MGKRPAKDAPAGASPRRLPLLALVFALGAQTMIVELSLPRLLAPAFGNTLFCWTAAISVVLAALALGYHAGGVVSARRPGTHAGLLWGLAAAASGWVVASGVWGDRIVGALSDLGMIAGPLVGTCLLAAPPAGLGASVLPIGVGLTAATADSGRCAGRLYACSTVGSVLGVLTTGYLLLPLLGVSGALFAAAALVFATFLLGRRVLLGAVGLGLLALLAATATAHRANNVLLDTSNGYHRIRVMAARENPQVRHLYLDSTIEGMVRLGSTAPVMPYQTHGVRIADAVPHLKRIFFLGGGTFSMPKHIQAKYPGVDIEVAEIDPDVVRVAQAFLEMPAGLTVSIGDARRILKNARPGYDLIVNDAFHGVREIPFHLVTREFHRLVAERLSPGGIYAVNVMGHPRASRLVQSVTRTLAQDFRHVHHFTFMTRDIQNIWILAGAQPIPLGDPAPASAEAGMIFTDNHAPVEYLIALDVTREARPRRH